MHMFIVVAVFEGENQGRSCVYLPSGVSAAVRSIGGYFRSFHSLSSLSVSGF